ncbi:5-oxoprolinase subunit B family protein [Teredinibacter haidensis]|uniref:5-oxoprolinase subunit B family protein n=1 Tax=Teredinibacter haidensis TaxID=2731755 RepID=UPI000948EA15|nr:allophanate hydrolase subunit 1 [Teredinibacter haidensis]
MSQPFPHIERLNENSLIIYFALTPGNAITRQIRFYWQSIEKNLGHLLSNSVPANTSLLLEFDDTQTDFRSVRVQVERLLQLPFQQNAVDEKLYTNHHIIPVLYHQDVAPDLESVAQLHGITINELVKFHCNRSYTVFSVGFVPGFAYMGDVASQIATPRQTSPRTEVAGGSVGIAEQQTGIYPRSSPGGWNIIGRTPITVLQPLNNSNAEPESSCLFKTGDQVSFTSIDKTEFNRLSTANDQ